MNNEHNMVNLQCVRVIKYFNINMLSTMTEQFSMGRNGDFLKIF